MTDRQGLLLAFDQAERALAEGTFPIGAIIVGENGQIIATGYNRVFSTDDPTAHAEVEAIRKIGSTLIDHPRRRFGEWTNTLYTTAEPCLQCVGAIVFARLTKVVWAADDPLNGFASAVQRLSPPTISDHLFRKIGRTAWVPNPYRDLADRQLELMRRWNTSRGLDGITWGPVSNDRSEG
ncbi:MAG: nucleoside deaminase [Firmicutes bacterium]|jgi:tRNA(adenine34) deaminase|nr:nucleoside deaminase [Bacillota bacterium]